MNAVSSDVPKPPKPPLRFIWIWVAAIALMFLLARPAYHLFKSWRAQTFLSRAQKALTEGNFNRAQEQSLLSLQMDPGQVDAIRVLVLRTRR